MERAGFWRGLAGSPWGLASYRIYRDLVGFWGTLRGAMNTPITRLHMVAVSLAFMGCEKAPTQITASEAISATEVILSATDGTGNCDALNSNPIVKENLSARRSDGWTLSGRKCVPVQVDPAILPHLTKTTCEAEQGDEISFECEPGAAWKEGENTRVAPPVLLGCLEHLSSGACSVGQWLSCKIDVTWDDGKPQKVALYVTSTRQQIRFSNGEFCTPGLDCQRTDKVCRQFWRAPDAGSESSGERE